MTIHLESAIIHIHPSDGATVGAGHYHGQGTGSNVGQSAPNVKGVTGCKEKSDSEILCGRGIYR